MGNSGLNGNTGVAFKGKPGTDAVQFDENSGLYFVHGDEFVKGYMGQYVMPVRREMASMFMASMIQAGEVSGGLNDSDAVTLASKALMLADALLLHEAESVQENLSKYYRAYLGDKDTKDVEAIMSAVMSEAQDHHLGGTFKRF